uniref:Uncharacterized protein n=1 Tax=Callorhinchus milii TaxID=7868 RepID=A0A4W3HME2_CALMI
LRLFDDIPECLTVTVARLRARGRREVTVGTVEEKSLQARCGGWRG